MKLTTWIALIFILMAGTALTQQHVYAQELTSATQSEMININTADAKTLSSLPGVGIKKAQAIVDYRERNGEFESVDELVNVKGIGKKMMAKIAGKVRL